MKAAKHPPTDESRQEAAIVVDIIARWQDDEEKKPNMVLAMVAACTVCGAEYSYGATTCTVCAPKLLSGMAPVLEQRRSSHETEHALVIRVVHGAVAEYLRRHPRDRSDGSPYTMVYDEDPAARDVHVICRFCGTNVNTFVRGRPPIGERFWHRVHKHTWACAAMYLAGMTSDRSPKKTESRTPVARLKGKDLYSEAAAAAEYLDIKAPVAGRYASRTRAHQLRWIVADARRLADARMRIERDKWSALRVQAEQFQIDRLLAYVAHRYSGFPAALAGLPWNDRRPFLRLNENGDPVYRRGDFEWNGDNDG